jgi:hypothetical protein
MYSKFLELVEKIKIKEEQQEPKAPPLNDQDWLFVVIVFLDTKQYDRDLIHQYILHSRTLRIYMILVNILHKLFGIACYRLQVYQ